MLAMKTECELCRRALTGHDKAWICSYECTYCDDCRTELPACPNCAGDLEVRPRRTTGAAAIAVRTPARIARRLGRRRR